MKTIRRLTKHDWNGNKYVITLMHGLGRYEVRVDGEFYATAESEFEAWEEISDIITAYHLH